MAAATDHFMLFPVTGRDRDPTIARSAASTHSRSSRARSCFAGDAGSSSAGRRSWCCAMKQYALRSRNFLGYSKGGQKSCVPFRRPSRETP